MKPEKQIKKSAAEIERPRKPETRIDAAEIETELKNAENKAILDFKALVDYKAARLDFQKDKNGEIESVTITRTLTGEILFHADNKTWAGRESIKKIME